jgi:TrmH family RNA methyltransferase
LEGILALLLPELSREKLRILRSLSSVKMRKRRGLCLVEGERALAEAFRSNRLKYLVAADPGTDANQGADPDAVPAADQKTARPPGLMADLPLYALEKDLFDELSDVRSGTGLLGVAGIPDPAVIDGLPGPGETARLFFLDGVQEPGNVGTLIRTAWALGMTGVLLGVGTADPFSRKAVRASAGGVFHLPLFYGTAPGIGPGDVDTLLAGEFSLFFAESGGDDYRQLRYPGRTILALGNEAAGISGWVRERGRAVGIPMAQGVDSLNVVVAGSIIAVAMIEP